MPEAVETLAVVRNEIVYEIIESAHLPLIAADGKSQLLKQLRIGAVRQSNDIKIELQESELQQHRVYRNNTATLPILCLLFLFLIHSDTETWNAINGKNIFQMKLANFIQPHSLIQGKNWNPITECIELSEKTLLRRHLGNSLENQRQIFTAESLFLLVLGKLTAFHGQSLHGIERYGSTGYAPIKKSFPIIKIRFLCLGTDFFRIRQVQSLGKCQSRIFLVSVFGIIRQDVFHDARISPREIEDKATSPMIS